MATLSLSLSDASGHLTAYADGLDIAADCERRIVASYAPEMAEWEAKDPSAPLDDRLTRKVRNSLEASANAHRIQKDADAIRVVLAALKGIPQ